MVRRVYWRKRVGSLGKEPLRLLLMPTTGRLCRSEFETVGEFHSNTVRQERGICLNDMQKFIALIVWPTDRKRDYGGHLMRTG